MGDLKKRFKGRFIAEGHHAEKGHALRPYG